MKNTDTGIVERIKEVMASQNMTMRTLSEATAIPYRTLQNYLRGMHNIPANALASISVALGVSNDWLLIEKAATFDMAIVENGLTIDEDIRGLSGGKVTPEERANMFVNFYERQFRERRTYGRRAYDKTEESIETDKKKAK